MAGEVGEFRVRCADLGDPNCKWEAKAKDEDELMRAVEQHAREAHNFPRLGQELLERVRSKMKAA
jgi:predicted small metal-binding protein